MRPALARAKLGMAAAADGLLVGIEVTRLKCCVAAAVYVLLGVYVSGAADAWMAASTWGACLAAALAVAAAFVHNDIEDEHVDGGAQPWRPIPSGRLARRTALRLFASLAALAVAVAWWSSSGLAWFSVAYLALSVVYSRHLKGTVLIGNATVAVLVGSLPLYGGVAAGNVDGKLLAAAAMVFFFSFGQEILFTLEDADGDAKAGLRTTATRLGAAASLRLFKTVMLVASIACLLPWYLGLATAAYGIAALLFTVMPTLFAAFAPRPHGDRGEIAVAATRMGLIWWTSIVPFVLLR